MKAVVLFNLGGPDAPEAVEPFLANLFGDPDVIRFPAWLRWLQPTFARRIARKRAPESAGNYAKIGGRSPLLPNTEAQARGLEQRLGSEYRVYIIMRYWHPRAAEVLEQIRVADPEELIFLPLYPQYSISTTAASVNEVEKILAEMDWNPRRRLIHHWHDRPGFAENVAATIRESLGDRDPAGAHLLFSAHGVPVSYVTKYGDPYQQHVEETVRAVMALLPPALEHSLCYQSRVGPVKWLQPDIADELERLAALPERKTVLLYPVSFVSEHIETLFELDILYGDLARERGLDYVRVPALGERPEFLDFLAGVVCAPEES